MRQQLALCLLVLSLSTPSYSDCKMSSNGARICGSKEKIAIDKPSDSSIFSFWNDKSEESKPNIEKHDNQTGNNDKTKKSKIDTKPVEKNTKQKNQVEKKHFKEKITTSDAKGVALRCDQSSLLFPKQTLSTDSEGLDVIADRSEISKKDLYILSGDVSLTSSKYYLAADNINIKKSTQTTTARGNIKYQDKELMFTGKQAIVKKQKNKNYITLDQVNFHYPESKISGQAKKVTNDGTEQVFDSASYSLCPVGNTDWRMKADKITLNSTANRGVAEDVTVEFFGVPIFYSPRHKWVLEGRGSGFLAPSFASYDESVANKGSGYQIRIPYYFNIAPDRDFLITLNQLSSRGSVVEGKYRQLLSESNYWNNGRFEIEGHYLNEDDITNNNRWLLNSKINLSINEKTSANIAIDRVSDVDYFKDIDHDQTSITALNSQADVSYQDNDRNLKLSVFTETEQLVNNGSASYTREPEVSISKSFKGMSDRDIVLSLKTTKFSHKDSSKTTGVRTHAQADFKRSISTDAYSLTPSLNLSTTDYALNNIADQDRSIYSFGIDSKLFLERETNLFDVDLIQTLTPRLAYNYTPKKNQSSLPSFDSSDKNDSYEGLFSGQKFTGIDRISNANSFTLGLESDFINEEMGNTYLSLKAAQAHHIDNQDMDSNGNLVDRRKYSDIAASADFVLSKLTFNNSLQFDPESGKVDKHDSAITYQSSPRKFLTIAHRDDNSKESAELYGAYPINIKTHVFAGINHSISDSITNKETTGIAYESCCWGVRLAHFKKHISGTNYDYVTDFELVLKGLASTSPGLSKRLEKDIPNYLSNLDDY